MAVEIFEDGSAVGIWRKCENTPSLPQCVSECCTFPHLMTATLWRDPATYVAHSDSDAYFRHLVVVNIRYTPRYAACIGRVFRED